MKRKSTAQEIAKQKVTIDRILKLVDAVGLVAHVKLTKVA